MDRIKELETQLKAAEYAAKFNYEGWQQEMKRSAEKSICNCCGKPLGRACPSCQRALES